jgi:CDP-6-deoxy-D-xylo-4-hexulose-3-dehydrase
LPEFVENSNPSWFGFLITLKENCSFTKQEMVEYLEQNGIGTRQLFAGNILRQPYFVENHIPLRIKDSGLLYSDELTDEWYRTLPNTEYIMNNTFWVGIFPALSEKELTKTSDVIHEFVKSYADR